MRMMRSSRIKEELIITYILEAHRLYGLTKLNILVFMCVLVETSPWTHHCVVRKFYAAANAIYSHTMNVHEMPRLCLFESFTLPLLTYGCDGLLLQGVH